MDNQEKKASEVFSEEEKTRVIEKINGELEFLKSARLNILKKEEAEENVRKLTSEYKKANKKLESAKKDVEMQIEEVWKTGYDNACGELAGGLSQKQRELGRLKNERAASKEKGIADRINKETEYLYRENKGKQSEIITIYNKDGAPFFCRLRFYFALFAPKSMGDFLIILITALIAFGGIPMLVWCFVPDRTNIHLLIIYAIAVLLAGGVYGLVLYLTRIKHAEAVKAARDISLQIRANKKKIKSIKKHIRSDEDESGYGLGNIDNKITGLLEEQDALSVKLEAAKTEFENVTKAALRSDIEAGNKKKLEALEAECDIRIQELTEAKKALDKLKTEYENIYLERLPKEYLKESKLDRLIGLFESGDAVSIDSAILIMKSMGR